MKYIANTFIEKAKNIHVENIDLNLIRIPYYNFNNIEMILNKKI